MILPCLTPPASSLSPSIEVSAHVQRMSTGLLDAVLKTSSSVWWADIPTAAGTVANGIIDFAANPVEAWYVYDFALYEGYQK
jgi:hypothetical protein